MPKQDQVTVEYVIRSFGKDGDEWVPDTEFFPDTLREALLELAKDMMNTAGGVSCKVTDDGGVIREWPGGYAVLTMALKVERTARYSKSGRLIGYDVKERILRLTQARLEKYIALAGATSGEEAHA